MPECIMYNFLEDKNKRYKKFTFRPAYIPKLKSMENTFFYKGANIYNDLPQTIKNLEHNKFQSNLKIYFTNFCCLGFL